MQREVVIVVWKSKAALVAVLVAALGWGIVGCGGDKSASTQQKSVSQTASSSQSTARPDQPGSESTASRDGLSDLVKEGTITQEEADAVREALRAEKPGADSKVSDILAGLVKKGTITQDQANAIAKVLPPRPTGGGPLAELVKKGTITEEQAAAVMQGMRGQKPGEAKDASDVLAELVKEGKLSQTQADAVEKAMEQNRPPKAPVSQQ